MYLRDIRISNVKLLHDFALSFSSADGGIRKWTVLVGENGACKTTLLQAIALAASGRDLANQLVSSARALRDTRLPDKEGPAAEIAADFTPVAPGTQGLVGEAAKARAMHSTLSVAPGESRFLGASSSAEADGDDPLGDLRAADSPGYLVAGYGVVRSLPAPVPRREDQLPRPSVGRLQSLFRPVDLVSTGFAEVLHAEWTKRYVEQLTQVLTQTAGLLPRVGRVELRGRGGVRTSAHLTEGHRFDFSLPGGAEVRVPATWLSHGYQSTIAWVADLLGYLFLETGGHCNPQTAQGLVLVDEIDLHLHPAWQVGLITALKHAFPSMQFIATTHSPLVLPGLEPDEIVVLGYDEQGNVVPRPSPEIPAIMTGSELYRSYFGVENTRLRRLRTKMLDYEALALDRSRDEPGEARMLELREELLAARIPRLVDPLPRGGGRA